MNKIFYISQIFLISISIIFSQSITSDLELNSKSYEAWTVEYNPYKEVVQDAIRKYLNRDKAQIIDIPMYTISQELIIVRAITNRSEIHQITYGTISDGYTNLDSEQINWIFGQTLINTLLERDHYFYLDYKLTNKKSNQIDLDYIHNRSYWSADDYVIDFPSRLTAKGFNNYYAFNLHWGDEFLGLPYNLMGAFKLGLASKYFEIGLITPSILNLKNGMITYQDSSSTLNKMTSGIGGYGQFHLSSFNGYLGFSSIPFLVENVDTLDLNHINFALQISYKKDIPLDKLVPFYEGTTVANLGYYSFQIANGRLNQNINLNQPNAIDVGNGYYYNTIRDTEFLSGLYFRLDGISKISDDKNYPRFKWTYQIHSNFNSLAKIEFNINNLIGLSMTATQSLNKSYNWIPKNTLFFGLIFNISDQS